MAKKDKQDDSIRTVELHPDAQSLMDDILAYCKKNDLGTKKQIMGQYYEVWERGDNMSEQLIKRGFGDRRAQIFAIDAVKAEIGRKVTRPKYGVILRPINVSHNTEPDDKHPGKIKHSMNVFGQCLLINLKKGTKFADEKFCDLRAYGPDCKKIDGLAEGKMCYIEAVTSNITPTVLNLVVDDRCGDMTTTDEELSDVEELLSQYFDITPINEAGDVPSENRYDLRLIEGTISYISFPREKSFAKLQLSDSSVTLEELEKKKNNANLTCLIDAETASKLGKGTVAKFLGEIKKKETPEYGLSISMYFPKMVLPVMLIEPEAAVALSDEAEDAGDYFKKKEEESNDEYFDDDEEDDEESVPDNDKEDNEDSNDEEKDDEEDEEEEATEDEDIPEEPEADEPEEEEEEEEEKPKKGRSKKADKKEDLSDKCTDFGHPAKIEKGKRGYDEGCEECNKENPDLYKACIESEN